MKNGCREIERKAVEWGRYHNDGHEREREKKKTSNGKIGTGYTLSTSAMIPLRAFFYP